MGSPYELLASAPNAAGQEVHTFSAALQALKAGKRVSRRSWHGIWVELQPAENKQEPHLYLNCDRTGYSHPTKIPWVPCQKDLFADDWRVIE